MAKNWYTYCLQYLHNFQGSCQRILFSIALLRRGAKLRTDYDCENVGERRNSRISPRRSESSEVAEIEILWHKPWMYHMQTIYIYWRHAYQFSESESSVAMDYRNNVALELEIDSTACRPQGRVSQFELSPKGMTHSESLLISTM